MSCDAFGDGNTNVLSYTKGYLTRASHNGMDIDYEYDGKGRLLKTSIAGVAVLTDSFEDSSITGGDSSSEMTFYGNATYPQVRITTVRDKIGNVKTVSDGSLTLLRFTYDDKERVKRLETITGETQVNYEYTYTDGQLNIFEKKNSDKRTVFQWYKYAQNPRRTAIRFEFFAVLRLSVPLGVRYP